MGLVETIDWDSKWKVAIIYGIFSSELSIHEQMVPYFGRHSCKMFIRGKALSFHSFFKYKTLPDRISYLPY